ncbi:hypothetical protein V6N12_072948 [Hibiscus sabdariffa]|uniref:Uncharacterized protein n=1 Tax=Hibiscus sabdariffa TaxID=183260 RepID=A0ABR2B4P3_9ROSI
MKDSCPPIQLMIAQDTLSLEASDSNALILPTKKSNKMRGKDQELQNPKLSRSQIKRLKKIEEEKEKALLLLKSLETLEKHKIPEDVYSLLLSLKTIDRAETMREKRRTSIQFSKVGLEVPHSVKSSKGWDRGNTSPSFSEPEIDLEQFNLRKDTGQNHIGPSMIIEKEVAKHAHDSLSSSQKLTFCKGLSPSCSEMFPLRTMMHL